MARKMVRVGWREKTRKRRGGPWVARSRANVGHKIPAILRRVHPAHDRKLLLHGERNTLVRSIGAEEGEAPVVC